MSTLRISDAPLLPDVEGTEKIPTGGRGDYAISVDQIKDHIFQDVGKELVGLGNVDNTSDLDKPVSTAQQAALDLKADKNYVDTNLDLKADKTNVYTRSETSLALSQKADLVNGVVPENQIPSSFNDVLEFTTPNLPIVGESGKIYVTTDTNKTWRWSTNKYVEISGWNPDSVSKVVTLPTYYTEEAGVNPVTGVQSGAYFNVRSEVDDTVAIEYQNVSGVATPTGKSYPSSIALNNLKHNNLKDRDVSGAHPASAILYASGENLEDSNDVNKATLISVFDFMTMAQFRQWKDNQTTYNVTFALQSALDAPNVFEVLLPQGTYLHSGLVSDKNNFRFYSNGYARSILLSDNTPHVALHVAKNVASVSGFFLDGIKLQGNANTLRGIQLGDATKAVQFCNLNNVMIDGFTKSDACDIYLGSVQELDIVNTMSWRGNIGIYRPTGGYGTSVKISGKAGYLGRHAKHGIKLDGQIDDIYVQDNVIEGNGLEAIYINDTAFKNTQGVTIYLQNAYFEANGQTGAGAGVVYAKGTSTAYKLHRIYASSCNFADNPNAPAGFKNIAGDYVALSVSGSSNMLPASIGVTNSYISYQANLTVSAGDITQQLKDLAALTGNKLIASGFDYIRSQGTSPSKNVQANFYSSITFPTTAVPSTDTTTLDDYREVSDFVPVVTGHGGTVSAATCRYTKIGNLVNFTIQLTTQNFTSTVGTTKVSLPHTQIVGAAAQFINNQNYSGGVALVVSQAVNLPTLPAQGSVATIYITGQYMTAQ